MWQVGSVLWAGQQATTKRAIGAMAVPAWRPCRPPCRSLAVSCPCRVMGQAGGPCTTLAFVPCRHGHATGRAVLPIGRAKRPCRGLCRRPMGCLKIYTLRRTSVSLEEHTPHRETSASLESAAPPRASSRLARGRDDPSGEFPPHSRVSTPHVSLHLAQGLPRPAAPGLLPRPGE
jgi:hypothetical protein